MQLHFDRLCRGPAWERWLIAEIQHGDPAYAGQVIVTYSGLGADAEVECEVMFNRGLTDSEVQELLDSVSCLLSGTGHITVFSVQELACREFDQFESDQADQQ